MRELVQSQPRSESYRAALALALSSSAGMEWSRDRKSAEKLAREALDIRRKLLREQPNLREMPGYLARSALQVADWCIATGRN